MQAYCQLLYGPGLGLGCLTHGLYDYDNENHDDGGNGDNNGCGGFFCECLVLVSGWMFLSWI